MTTKYEICRLDELPNGGSRGFSLCQGQDNLEIFIIREDDQVYGYINRCPHTGVNLNWKPDQFLNLDGDLIQCSTHGARFRIDDGYCVYGPCAGQSLIPITLNINDEKIIHYIKDNK